MRLTPFSTLSLLSVAVGISLATTAQAAQPPAPDLSNSEFQQCLDNLKNSMACLDALTNSGFD